MRDRTLSAVTAVGLLALAVAVYVLLRPAGSEIGSRPTSRATFQPVPGLPRTTGSAPGEGTPAPTFSARRLDGSTLRLADLRGQGVVLNFFASWCTPCREEASTLEGVHAAYRNRGVAFLGVDIKEDTWEDAREFLAEAHISYPAVRDETGTIAERYRLTGLPTTYFIDPTGVVRSKFIGPFLGENGRRELERRVLVIVPSR